MNQLQQLVPKVLPSQLRRLKKLQRKSLLTSKLSKTSQQKRPQLRQRKTPRKVLQLRKTSSKRKVLSRRSRTVFPRFSKLIMLTTRYT